MQRAFEFIIWRPVNHNGKFSHYTSRRVVIEAESQRQARQCVILKGRAETVVHEDLTVTAEDEYIHSARQLYSGK